MTKKKRSPKTAILGAIQGVIGDKLPKGWMRFEMGFYDADTRVEPHTITLKSKHICIFIHGNSDTEHGWFNGESSYGTRLEAKGIHSLYLRYNSGLALAQNGEALSMLLDALAAAQPRIKRISVVAHSMGGLIFHSAGYHALAQSARWPQKVKQVFLLGTPHEGAPLAKLVENAEWILQFIPNPITLMSSRVLSWRSAGLKDLSRGEGGLPAQGKILLPQVRYFFFAGGLQKKNKSLVNRAIGDGMVRTVSAHRNIQSSSSVWRKLFSFFSQHAIVTTKILSGVSHIGLRNHPAVFAEIEKQF